MLDRAQAEAFARDWIEGWNSGDLDRILAHYADDFEMTSPLIVERCGLARGKLKGKEAVRDYWANGLKMTPNLRFRLLDVAVGVSSLAIIYESVTLGRVVVERIEFDGRGRAIGAEAMHATSSLGVGK